MYFVFIFHLGKVCRSLTHREKNDATKDSKTFSPVCQSGVICSVSTWTQKIFFLSD